MTELARGVNTTAGCALRIAVEYQMSGLNPPTSWEIYELEWVAAEMAAVETCVLHSAKQRRGEMPRINFDPTEMVTFELAEPGTYPMRIAHVSDVEQGPKAPYVTLEYNFVDPELARKCGSVWRNYPIAGKGAGFFFDMWKKVTGEEVSDPTELDTDDLVGKEVVCEIGHHTWEGTTRNDVVKVIG